MNEEENQQRDPTFADFYRMIIAPVAHLLDEGEVIIVPDRLLFKVPFSALVDENEKYLSETFRVRIVPSLTTLLLLTVTDVSTTCEVIIFRIEVICIKSVDGIKL